MEQCPYCKSTLYELVTVNQVKMKKCSSCGACYEDAGEPFEINTFVPVYERDENGDYPGCPKCGCRKVRRLKVDEMLIRGGLMTALIAVSPMRGTHCFGVNMSVRTRNADTAGSETGKRLHFKGD